MISILRSIIFAAYPVAGSRGAGADPGSNRTSFDDMFLNFPSFPSVHLLTGCRWLQGGTISHPKATLLVQHYKRVYDKWA